MRIKGLIREYYLTKSEATKKEFEEANASSRSSSPGPAGAEEGEGATAPRRGRRRAAGAVPSLEAAGRGGASIRSTPSCASACSRSSG